MASADVYHPQWTPTDHLGRWVRGPYIPPQAKPVPVEDWSTVKGKKMAADGSVKANRLRTS
jgi:hypothetical protein